MRVGVPCFLEDLRPTNDVRIQFVTVEKKRLAGGSLTLKGTKMKSKSNLNNMDFTEVRKQIISECCDVLAFHLRVSLIK